MPEDIEDLRSRERQKYLYLVDNHPGYGRSTHGLPLLDEIVALKPALVLDFGCGANLMVKLLHHRGIPGIGIDWANPGADLQAPMHKTTLREKCSDMILCFDALEHLLPVDVPLVLQEMHRVAAPGARFFFSVSTQPSRWKVNGEGLHPTVRDRTWWAATISEVARLEERKDRFFTGRFREPGHA